MSDNSVPLPPANEAPPPSVPGHDLLRVIGLGAYGEVWLARNRTTDVFRAVKVVWRRKFKDAKPYERELRGLKAFEPVSRGHEGLVYILEVAENEAEGYFYCVMELADNLIADCGSRIADSLGEDGGSKMEDGTAGHSAVVHPPSAIFDPQSYRPKTLSAVLAQRGRLPLDECVKLGLTLSGGLEFMHARELVHRDVKPANIIYVGGVPKLADIGLVVRLGETLTRMGTLVYLLKDESAGQPEGDLFALGKVLYEASTGHGVEQFPELPTDITSQPEQTALGELNQVVLRACEEKPKQRYQKAEELRADLLWLQSGRSLRQVRKNERYVAVAKKAAVGVLVLAVAAFFVNKQELAGAQMRARVEEQSRSVQRETNLQHALLPRLSQHRSGWASNSLYFSGQAASPTDDPRNRSLVQSQAAAALLGLDCVSSVETTNADA
jgi:serine/threonine protein kinase